MYCRKTSSGSAPTRSARRLPAAFTSPELVSASTRRGDRGVHLVGRLDDLVAEQIAVRRPGLELEPGEDRLPREPVSDRAGAAAGWTRPGGSPPCGPGGRAARPASAITWSTVCRIWQAPPIANVSTAATQSFSVVSSGSSGPVLLAAQPAEELVHVAEVARDEEQVVDAAVVEVREVEARAEDAPAGVARVADDRAADRRPPRPRGRAAPGRPRPRWSAACRSPRRSGGGRCGSRDTRRARGARGTSPPRSATPVARKSSSRSSAASVGRSIDQTRCAPQRGEASTNERNRPCAISMPSLSGSALVRSTAICARVGTSPGKRSAAA